MVPGKHGLLLIVQSGCRRNRSTVNQNSRTPWDDTPQVKYMRSCPRSIPGYGESIRHGMKKGPLDKTETLRNKWSDVQLAWLLPIKPYGSSSTWGHPLRNSNVGKWHPTWAMLSPDAFITMINDLPENVTTADTSLFAVDGTWFVEKKRMLCYHATEQKMPGSFKRCPRRVHKWGFKLSSEKSVAVLFTQQQQKKQIQWWTWLPMATTPRGQTPKNQLDCWGLFSTISVGVKNA